MLQVTETFVLPAPKVDILYVADTSSSISLFRPHGHQMMMEGFADTLEVASLDWRFAVVPGHVEQAELPRSFGSRRWTNDADELRSGVVHRNVSPEGGRDPVFAVMGHDAYEFVRDEAELHVLFVTDNIDNSVLGEQDFLAFMKSLKAAPAVTRLHAISLVESDAECTYKFTAGAYSRYAHETGGVHSSYCSPWNPVIEQLDLGHTSAGQSHVLEYVPDGPIRVHLQGAEAELEVCPLDDGDCDITYDAATNTLAMTGTALQPGLELTINYERTPTPDSGN